MEEKSDKAQHIVNTFKLVQNLLVSSRANKDKNHFQLFNIEAVKRLIMTNIPKTAKMKVFLSLITKILLTIWQYFL